jgi:hypothetical protein
MRHGKIQTSIRWTWAFANVMLHSCTPVRAADIIGFGLVAAIPGDDASFDHASVDSTARRLCAARGDGPMSINQSTPKVAPGLETQGQRGCRHSEGCSRRNYDHVDGSHDGCSDNGP